MVSDHTLAGWCPVCGEEVPRRYPRCTKDRTPTPLFVEINALTQYLVGVPTFVEFRLLNCSDEPVTLGLFEASLGGKTLEPGIHPESPGLQIAPREEQPVVLDRKVDFGIDRVMPGEYNLEIELVYAHEGKTSRLNASHPVRFAQPLDRRIYAYNHATKSFDTYEGRELPEVEPMQLERTGEQTIRDHRVMHLCRMKQDAGLRFLPVRMCLATEEADSEPSWVEAKVPACEGCGALLREGGLFCHACGHKQAKAVEGQTPTEAETEGFCPYCTFPRGRLRGRYHHCPLCGKPIDAHVSIFALPSYMAGVQVKTDLRIHGTSRDPLHIRSIRAFIGERSSPLDCAFLEEVNYGIELAPDENVDLPCLIGFPQDEKAGDRKLTIEIEYDCRNQVCRLSGSTGIRLLPGAEKLGTIIHQYGAQSVNMAGDALMSQGAWNINHADSIPLDKREEFMRKLAELVDVPERPVHLHTVAVSALGPSITWEPSHRATLWFMNEGSHHRYCIANIYRPESGQFEPVSFGRNKELNPLRLLEIEAILERKEKEKPAANMSLSMVSKIQWVVRVSPEAASVGLEFTHRSTSNTSFVGKNRKLGFGDSVLLGLHEQIECRRQREAKSIIGLQYGAHALPFPAYESARSKARAALDAMTHPPEHFPEWPARIGGYRLNRLHSLTGEMLPEKKDLQTLEAYVLLPAWATIGSAPTACIVVPDESVAPTHAYLLHVDGYFFILPHSAKTRVVVEGNEVPAEVPWPLRPEKTEIQLGEAVIKFDRFSQAFLE